MSLNEEEIAAWKTLHAAIEEMFNEEYYYHRLHRGWDQAPNYQVSDKCVENLNNALKSLLEVRREE